MLYIVATPIGNIKDITLRAIEILKEVDLILCEDTRETIKLLNYYGIKKKLLSYYKDIEKKRVDRVIELLKEGKEIALVCDRGTPGISDPAYVLVNEAYKNNIKVIPVPGPSALTASLSISGFPLKNVYFIGFIPKKENEKKKIFEKFKEGNETIIFFESV
ncbi:MAG: 16S rRNA (cytidine(1402)-2'-O)-methyltransferase, partial [bacterium]|nr:16S rRNA (cytidine(1402)-2'-O)-methyltransferase [bacterium]